MEQIVSPIKVDLGQAIVSEMANCCYDKHSDASANVNNPETILRSDNRSLPTAAEQQTLTMCSQDKPEGEVELKWYEKKTNKCLLTIIVKRNSWHWQCALIQKYLKHDVKWKNGGTRLGKDTNRLMVSFREANNPVVDRRWYNKRLYQDARDKKEMLKIYKTKDEGEYSIKKDVLVKISDPTYNFDQEDEEEVDGADGGATGSGNNDDADDEESVDADMGDVREDDKTWFAQEIETKYNLRNPKYSDKFGKITEKRFLEHNITRPGLLFSSDEELGFFSNSAALVTALLEHGIPGSHEVPRVQPRKSLGTRYRLFSALPERPSPLLVNLTEQRKFPTCLV